MVSIQPKLTIKQSQTLQMTQSLQEAIGLLQIPAAELRSYLSSHIEANPLLEFVEDSYEEAVESFEDVEAASPGSDGTDSDYLLEATYSDRQDFIASSSGNEPLDSVDQFATLSDSGSSLVHDLLIQASVAFSKPHERKIAEYFIYTLDESGFLKADLEEFACSESITRTTLENVLTILKTFDPVGVFSKNPAENFEIQLKRANIWDKPFEIILTNLTLVGSYDWKKLQKLTQLSPEELKKRITLLKSLKPKPFDGTYRHVQLRIPDLILERAQGKYTVCLNLDALPKIKLNRGYFDNFVLKPSKEEATYLRQQEREGNWLLKALEKRATTLLKVGQLIVQKQQAFFDHGLRYLKPLTLNEVAQAIDVHESTVSRVVTQKYLQSPAGIFELKFFFSPGLKNVRSNEQHTNKFIQDRLTKLIEQEPPESPYSDEALVHLLAQESITIARRTIAKYREVNGIQTASQRKRIKTSS